MDIAPEIKTLVIGMMPLAELRLAIPLGTTMGLTQFQAFFYGTLGNILVVMPIIFLYEPVAKFLSAKSKLCHKIITYINEHTRKKHSAKFDKYGSLALIMFVAIPLPGTGGWTGSLAAYVFGVNPKRAYKLITLGIIIAGVLVSIGWEGAQQVGGYMYRAYIGQ